MTKRAMLLEALASTTSDLARLVRGLNETAEPAATRIFADLLRQERAFQEAVQPVAGPLALTPAADTMVAPPSLAEGLAAFAAERQRTLALVEPLPPKAWQQKISNAAHRSTLRYLTQDLVAHDIELTGRLAQLRADPRRATAADGEPAT